MSKKNQGMHDPTEDAIGQIIVWVMIIGAFIAIAYFTKPYWRYAWGVVTIGETYVVEHFPFYSDERRRQARIIRAYVKPYVDARKVDAMPDHMHRKVSVWAHKHIRWLYGAFIGFSVLTIYFSWKGQQRVSFKWLMQAQSHIYPHLKIPLTLDLAKSDADKGLFRFRAKVSDYARAHGLLDAYERAVSDDDDILEDEKRTVYVLNRERTSALLASQLGKPWQGFDRMSDGEKLLLAGLQAKSGSDEAFDHAVSLIIDSLHGDENADWAEVTWTPALRKLCKKAFANPEFKKILDRHAYVRTAIPELTEYTMQFGPLSSAPFKWLKALDREAYYLFQDFGHNPSALIAGADCHGRYERSIGRPVRAPYVEPAVDGFIEELWLHSVAERDDELDFSVLKPVSSAPITAQAA